MEYEANTGLNPSKLKKLTDRFPAYLESKRASLSNVFGKSRTEIILHTASESYLHLLSMIRTYNTPMYDSLMLEAAKMAALKKGMNAAGIPTKDFVKFSIGETRQNAEKIPSGIKKLGGRFYLSRLMRWYLKRVGMSVTQNGWPTKVLSGRENDDFSMKVETRNCQMVAYWEAIGEGDIKPYCTFFDFSAAEILNVGLKQESSYESGVCTYCFRKQGNVEWPEKVLEALESPYTH